MPERRRFHRWHCQFTCGYEGNVLSHSGVITDLSYGGARISEVDHLPLEGSDIGIVLYTTPENQKIELQAHVSYVNENGFFGIQFYLTPEEKTEVLVPLFKSYLERD
jgi:hypothetical protein